MTNIDKFGKSALVAMSGGVDSSVAALLLHEQGMDICGFTCKMFGEEAMPNEDGECCSTDDANDAKAVCGSIGKPHYTFNCKRSFKKNIIERFVSDYNSGLTPNPCIDCNRYVKFGDMHRLRAELGVDFLATGHYATTRFDEATGRWQLLRAKDKSKDQSYVLTMLTQDQLAHTIFPLGSMTKDEVRNIAARANLTNASKPDSQDICFVPDGDYASFIERWSAEHSKDAEGLNAGSIEDIEGNVLGHHNGIARYTIGQRKGIGVAAREPLYVVAKDAERNVIIVGPKDRLMTKSVYATDVNFIGVSEESLASSELQVLAKCSYRQDPQLGLAKLENGLLTIEFDSPRPKTAPGQAVVLYDAETGESVLAGGTATI